MQKIRSKKILVVPDIHGRSFWKEPVGKNLNVVDRIVFLGDYLDPYPDEVIDTSPNEILHNLKEIIELKRNYMEKVVLLKGNHDQHYASKRFCELAGGTRMDKLHWDEYHEIFKNHKDLFKIVYWEIIKGIPYLFSHAGLTVFWLNKVNSMVWHLGDNKISVADQDIVNKLNALDDDGQGQDMLSVIGTSRSWFSNEKSGSVLWADLDDHPIQYAPHDYALDQVFQVFGHTRLKNMQKSMIMSEGYAMIDSQQCFMIDEDLVERIVAVSDYDNKCIIGIGMKKLFYEMDDVHIILFVLSLLFLSSCKNSNTNETGATLFGVTMQGENLDEIIGNLIEQTDEFDYLDNERSDIKRVKFCGVPCV